jgi:peptidoglycan/xylan/chitin deacetylase (PgdA/CDA1 family)
VRPRPQRTRILVAVSLVAVAAVGALAYAAVSRHEGEPPEPRRAASGATRAAEPAQDRMPTAAEQEAALHRFRAVGLPIWCGGGRRGRYVALTFDDGPGPYTPIALNRLRAVGARATFFLVGRKLAGGERLVAREHAQGAVGDHAWTHDYLPGMAAQEAAGEVERTQRAIRRAGGSSVRLWRPPFAASTPALDRRARELGLLKILWSVDSRDALGDEHAAIARNVIRGLRPGSIVLLHENRGQTLRALRRILPALRRLRVQAVTVPELLVLDPPSVEQLRRRARGCPYEFGAPRVPG